MSPPQDFSQHVKISPKPHSHRGNLSSSYITTLTIYECLASINDYLPTVPQEVNWYLHVIDGNQNYREAEPKAKLNQKETDLDKFRRSKYKTE